ncbi:hypothetical protein HRR83_001824 [Exophiala dermatitidis]|uniref:Inositolphosphotransferase Aur1/Ipt1 domain-containing protein n=1 Tax=Exophiala dermatitidis TaxID=5970 RepID=A0AAN6F1K7_EXODE|nr:hypothetical protein HRR73_004955 [Exophiala dermatitidis]KAJ4523281.1 hypothetical protein HRR75_001682 [Exophiala dermatitidis]KAJ4526627.1 hypothetical protein HRR74_001827 [Exophiala dermatitidis]KAJ4532125.1 hypothetical protein HRR76_007124 [Exophiala dermatitidis]KAJ4546160.1 hypothetical protein HRR77_004697 [Exophiala dermatitidis]
MGAGVFLEPLAVVVLLFGGAWINRATDYSWSGRYGWDEPLPVARPFEKAEDISVEEAQSTHARRSLSPSLLVAVDEKWREREVRFLGYCKVVRTPNTAVFRGRLLSRVLHKFPFLVEAWYWALIYWVYQLGRAFTAVTLVEGTVHVARRHALQVIELEKRLHIFWEIPIQKFFMAYPRLMMSINWLYSFIHIPGTIAFLVWLYYYTITSDRHLQKNSGRLQGVGRGRPGSPAGACLYEARRRTMAVCNLLAFVVFTLWPCMPPRLLSDPEYTGPQSQVARSYGFVDTVHGKEGASSVWTQNRFCNQYAAMPSLHFGYSLMIGVTIMTVPLAPEHRRTKSFLLPFFNRPHPELAPAIRLPNPRRLACLVIGFMYPFTILVAIVATANHFILDAVAGAAVCIIGWRINPILLNLLPLEDWFLWALRIHKPVQTPAENETAFMAGTKGGKIERRSSERPPTAIK